MIAVSASGECMQACFNHGVWSREKVKLCLFYYYPQKCTLWRICTLMTTLFVRTLLVDRPTLFTIQQGSKYLFWAFWLGYWWFQPWPIENCSSPSSLVFKFPALCVVLKPSSDVKAALVIICWCQITVKTKTPGKSIFHSTVHVSDTCERSFCLRCFVRCFTS